MFPVEEDLPNGPINIFHNIISGCCNPINIRFGMEREDIESAGCFPLFFGIDFFHMPLQRPQCIIIENSIGTKIHQTIQDY